MTTYNECPCDECICYPICRNKTVVKCSILYEYISRRITGNGELYKPECLPNLMQITRGPYTYP